MRPLRAAISVLAALSLLAAVASPTAAAAGSSWPQFHYSATKSGYNPNETILNASNVAGLRVVWQRAFDAPIEATPLVAGANVFAQIRDGRLIALNRHSGAVKWTARVGSEDGSYAPALWGKLIIAAGNDSTSAIVAAFNAKNGHMVWQTRLSPRTYAITPTVYGNSIWLVAGGAIYDLSAATGSVIWHTTYTTSEDGYIDGALAVSGGGQYVIGASLDGWVYSLNADTGTVHWQELVGGGIHRGGPAIYQGVIYVPEGLTQAEGGGVNLTAIQVSDGRVLWRSPAGGDVHVTPAVGPDGAFIGEIDNFFHAFDLTTGAAKWSSPIEVENWGAPVLANHLVYIGTDLELEVMTAATGQLLYSSPTGSNMASFASPAVVDGRVYLGTGDGRIVVLGLK